ncbi:MAG: hypothetical protein H6718_04080 [Polyangiaceae bacterium]|nr:hypothetical protein [Polyangiaceae bacterium]
MALDATRLSNAIRLRLITKEGFVDNPCLQDFCDVIAEEIVTEVQQATVVPTLLVAPSGGGPVTGTGGIT